jgi:hypothetical protein
MAVDDDLTEDQLLNLPEADISPGSLSEFFARRSGVAHQRETDELMAELSGTSSRRLMISANQDPAERLVEEEKRRRASQAYEEEMQDIRTREDRLLARIDEQELIDRKHLKETEDNALKLHDGRRAYVDGDNFRDDQGRQLTGADADEARRLHGQNPNASTWQDRQRDQDRIDEDERQRQRILDQRAQRETDSANAQNLSPDELARKRGEAEHAISSEEKEFDQKVQTAYTDAGSKSPGDLAAAYSTDYSDLYDGTDAGRTTSYAKQDAAEGKVLAADFKPAATGQTTPDKDKAPPSPSAPAPGASV